MPTLQKSFSCPLKVSALLTSISQLTSPLFELHIKGIIPCVTLLWLLLLNISFVKVSITAACSKDVFILLTLTQFICPFKIDEQYTLLRFTLLQTILLRIFLYIYFGEHQFSSVTESCLTLCNPMDCSMPGFPVHHQLPELAQTHVH